MTVSKPFLLMAGERRGELPAGVVDQAVDAAVAADHFGHGGAHRLLVADVAGHHFSAAAVFG
jgi:hypothetical protein